MRICSLTNILLTIVIYRDISNTLAPASDVEGNLFNIANWQLHYNGNIATLKFHRYIFTIIS